MKYFEVNNDILKVHPKLPMKLLVDEGTFQVFNAYEDQLHHLTEKIEDLEFYKRRQIDAFTIGDAVSDGIFLTDKDGYIHAINKSYEEITGLSEADVINQNVRSSSHLGYFDHILTLRCLEEKKRLSTFSTLLSKDRSVIITANPFFNEEGEVEQVLTVIRDLTEIMKVKERLEKAEQESEKYKNALKEMTRTQPVESHFIGESEAVKKIKELIRYVAKTEATVLITGETGSGKEVVAKEIHRLFSEQEAPYIKVNCAAIPDNLLESELFGYEKGAFTGALNKNKPGMFELANGGTLLLDEIGEMPLNLQSKLLRVLQEKELRRIGGVNSIQLNARIIASTNQDLPALIKQKKFREDLYYRLNVVPIHIPPLRERKEDIALLIYKFLENLNRKYQKQKRLEHSALTALERYDWPGNVRELSNILERIVVSDDNDYVTENSVHLILGRMSETDGVSKETNLKDAVEALEHKMIRHALQTYGSTYKAAEALGMSQPTLFRKSKKYQINIELDES